MARGPQVFKVAVEYEDDSGIEPHNVAVLQNERILTIDAAVAHCMTLVSPPDKQTKQQYKCVKATPVSDKPMPIEQAPLTPEAITALKAATGVVS